MPSDANAADPQAAQEERLQAALKKQKTHEEDQSVPKPPPPMSGFYMAIFHALFVAFLAGTKGYIAMQLAADRALTSLDASIGNDLANFWKALQNEASHSWYIMLAAFAPVIPIAMIKSSAKLQTRYFRATLFLAAALYLSLIVAVEVMAEVL